jgi:hypothetical protein
MDRSGVVRRASVPPLTPGGTAVAERLDRHFALLTQAPAVQPERVSQADDAVALMRSLTSRPPVRQRRPRFGRLSLAAPLRSLRRFIGL